MKFQANTVAANFTYNGIPISISMIVNCLTHITQKTPGLYFLKSKFYTFFRYLNQFLFSGLTSPMQNIREESENIRSEW